MPSTPLSTAFCALSIAANALTAGSMFTYPVFAPALQFHLNFSVTQLSATASVAILSQYISAAFWGSLADRLGPGRVSLSAAVLFFMGYTTLSYLLSSPSNALLGPLGAANQSAPTACWIHVTLAYSLCGAATAASFFAAITASTQVFAAASPGLSIAGPSALFGLSPLLLTLFGTRFFSHPDYFDTPGYLGMLAVLTLAVNLIGAAGLQQQAVDLTLEHERTALLPSAVPPSRPDGLASGVESFLSDPVVWLLGMVVLLSAGPAEMTIASIGAVADVHQPGRGVALKATHVQLISIANTLARLASGWLSDSLCGPRSARRLAFLAAAPAAYCIVCFWTATNGGVLWVLSLVTGICYGIVFTLAPSLVSTVWPISDFGRNYGIISYFSATGSFVFTLLFGIVFKEEDGRGAESVRLVYGMCGVSEIAAVGLAAVWYQFYWGEGRMVGERR